MRTKAVQIVEYRSRLVRTFLAILVAVALSGQIFGAERAQQPAERARGIVVTVSPPASDVGLAVLNQGGNAVDATVATALALAVTWPAAGNVGGGGFMMVYPGPEREPVCVEYRETAPAAATAVLKMVPSPICIASRRVKPLDRCCASFMSMLLGQSG